MASSSSWCGLSRKRSEPRMARLARMGASFQLLFRASEGNTFRPPRGVIKIRAKSVECRVSSSKCDTRHLALATCPVHAQPPHLLLNVDAHWDHEPRRVEPPQPQPSRMRGRSRYVVAKARGEREPHAPWKVRVQVGCFSPCGRRCSARPRLHVHRAEHRPREWEMHTARPLPLL